jgi:hypothetical protein
VVAIALQHDRALTLDVAHLEPEGVC